MWDLPRPGLEPVSPALAGGFSTTAPPGKPQRITFDSLTCPHLVFLSSVNGLTIWLVIQTESLTFKLLSFFVSRRVSNPCSSPINSGSISNYFSLYIQRPGPGQHSLSLGHWNNCTAGLSVSTLASRQCFLCKVARVFLNGSHLPTHLLWLLSVLSLLWFIHPSTIQTMPIFLNSPNSVLPPLRFFAFVLKHRIPISQFLAFCNRCCLCQECSSLS